MIYNTLWIALGLGGLLLAIREGLGFWDRKDGYVTISELARKEWKLQLAIALLFADLLAWWLVHSGVVHL